MAKGIRIPIASDTREFSSGVKKGVIQPLEDLEDTLDDVAKAGDDATDDLIKGFDKASDEVSDFKKEQSEVGKALSKSSRDAGTDFGKNIKKGTDKGEEGLQGFKDEAKQNAEEVAASFDGSVESIVDGFQGLASKALSGFGPAGVVAGVAAAAGIGLAVAGFEAADEAAKESEARSAEWADSFIEAGGRVLAAGQILAKAQSIYTDPDAYKMATQNARDWGVSVGIAVAAMSGDLNALAYVTDSLATETEKAEQKTANFGRALNLNGEAQGAHSIAVKRGANSLGALTKEMKAGEAQADDYSETLRFAAENAEDATKKVDKFGDTIYSLPDGTQVYIDAETGKATQDVKAIEKKIYGIKDQKVAVAVSGNTNQLKADIAKATAKQTLTLVINAIDRTGKKIS